MLTRRIIPGALAAALFAPTAEALTIARVTRNDTRGGPTERFDDNPSVGTAFPIAGLVAINSFNYDLSASLRREGETLCLQEFAHRFGAYLRVPPARARGDSDAARVSILAGLALCARRMRRRRATRPQGSPLRVPTDP